VDGNATKALHSEGSLGFSANAGQTLADSAQVRRRHAMIGKEPVEETCRRYGLHQVTVDPTICVALGNGDHCLAEPFGLAK
jgi:hypothetical protein